MGKKHALGTLKLAIGQLTGGGAGEWERSSLYHVKHGQISN